MHWKPNPLLYPPYLRARIRRGRGVGEGSSYKPWLDVRDVPSRGTSSIVQGTRVDRPHSLLSENETIYFYLIERKQGTADIREQWPILDIDRTLELCQIYGVHHQYRASYPEPFTIDFLITTNLGGKRTYRAASVKTAEDARDPEVRVRLMIENVWCREQGIPWTLIDTSTFNKTLLANLRFMRAWFRHGYHPELGSVQQFSQQFAASYARNIPLKELIRHIANRLRKPEALATDEFRYCVWADFIKISLTQPLALNKPLALQEDHERA